MAYADTLTRARLAKDDAGFRFAMTFGTSSRVGQLAPCARATDPANNVCDPTQGISNSGWKVPGVVGVRSCNPHTIVIWFNLHVRDALAFNY